MTTTLAQPRHDPSGRRKWDAVATSERWDRYRLLLDITDLLALRDHLAGLDLSEHDADLYEVFVALDEEVRTIPPETITLIRQEQP